MVYINSYGHLVNTDYLAHYGILGMHWGIRRFQPYPKGHSSDGKYVGDKPKKVKAKKEPKTMTYEQFVAKQRRKEVAKRLVKRALLTVGAMALTAGVRYVFAQAGLPIVPGKRIRLRGYDENFENLKQFFKTKDPTKLWDVIQNDLPTTMKYDDGTVKWKTNNYPDTYLHDLGYTYKPKLPDEKVLNKWTKWSPS